VTTASTGSGRSRHVREPGENPACCVPPGSREAGKVVHPSGVRKSGANDRSGMVRLEGGPFLMGTDDREGFPADGEGPVREVTVRPFRIDRHAVSNARFATFVTATDAERYG
jgi:formylglycine-generating enzyme